MNERMDRPRTVDSATPLDAPCLLTLRRVWRAYVAVRRSTAMGFCVATIRNKMWSAADIITPPMTTNEEP